MYGCLGLNDWTFKDVLEALKGVKNLDDLPFSEFFNKSIYDYFAEYLNDEQQQQIVDLVEFNNKPFLIRLYIKLLDRLRQGNENLKIENYGND